MKIKQLFFAIAAGFSLLIFTALPIKAQEINPVVWKTNYAKLAASNFHIRIGDKYYYGNDDMRVTSSPGTERTTLELTWNENNTPMRIFFYFQKRGSNEWELYDLRTYDGTSRGDWIFYSPKDSLGNEISSLTGMHYYAQNMKFLPKDNSDAEIVCKECGLTAFLDIPLKYSSYGYALEVLNGLENNETITISNNPTSGYGVNVLLRDKNKEVVANQSNITYQWKPQNTNIVEIQTMNLEYPEGKCAYGIDAPCPYINGQIRGISPGVTTVDVSVIQNGTTIASNSFDVKVTGYYEEVVHTPQVSTPTPVASVKPSSTPTPTMRPTPTPTVTPTTEPDYEKFQEEIEVLKGAVGEIQLEARQQREDLNILQRMVESIMSFFKNFSWFK